MGAVAYQDNFTQLARDRSLPGRLRLVTALADAYLRPDIRLSDAEATQLDGFVEELFRDNVPLDVRKLLSHRAAQATRVPPLLVTKLIHDEIGVAGPMLAKAEIDDEDLLRVIGVKRTPYRMAIAGRASVSEAVADALVTTGDAAVVEVLLKNFGAKLNRASIARCVAMARQLQVLRPALVQRPELTAEDAAALLWWLPRELRQIVAARFGGLASVKPGHVGTATLAQPAVAEMLQRWAQKPPSGAAAERAAAWIVSQTEMQAALQQGTGGELLTKILRLKLPDLFAATLAQLTRLPPGLVVRCCADRSGQTLAVFCCALGVPRAVFASLFMLAHAAFQNGRALAPATLNDLLVAYDRIGPRAGAMLQAWRQNPELLKARV